MIAIPSLKHIPVRPVFLFGLGAQLGGNGLLVLGLYYLIMSLSAPQAEELLGWMVPVAQGCCLLAAVALAAGLTASLKDATEEDSSDATDRGARGLARGAESSAGNPFASGIRQPTEEEVKQTLALMSAIDWKIFKDLGSEYYRALGFSVVDQPSRGRWVDFLLYMPSDTVVVGVRCLPWGTKLVTLPQVKEIHRSILLAGANRGVVLTTGAFDEEALEYAKENDLDLNGGERFATRLLLLPEEVSRRLLQRAAGAERIRDEGMKPPKKPAVKKRLSS
jgi:hypothetical protein